MTNVIMMEDKATWWTMNMLKQSIAHMKKVNVEGKYDSAIEKEETILRAFFDEALGRLEPAAMEVAA